ncbi:MAG: hypothetical protein IJ789_06240 [Bacteroidales bacterium]|nr:hypothetical protein [Bacteroidales bacterium]
MEQSKYQVGDRVKFVNAIGGGVVTKVEKGLVYVEDESGFDVPMPPQELIRMADQDKVGRVFNDETIGSVINKAKEENREPTLYELEEENRRLRSQNANLQDQIKQLKSQVLSLQRTVARIS